MRAFVRRGGLWVLAQGILMGAIFLAWMAGGTSWGVAVVVTGLGVALVGAVLAIAGLGFLGRNLTPFPVPRGDTALVDRGPYGIVRHPIYGGIVVGALGISLADGNPLAMLLTAALAVLFTVKTVVEERHLVHEVPGYEAYRRRVRGRILPFVP